MCARILALLLILFTNCLASAHQTDQLSVLLLLDDGTENLPYQLGCLDKLTFSKENTHIWIGGADGELESLQQWIDGTQKDFIRIDQYQGSKTMKTLPLEQRLEHLLRHGADEAIKASSRYALVLTANVFIHHASIVEHLINLMKNGEGVAIVSPMLDSRSQDPTSNFQCFDDLNCDAINQRTETGVFNVSDVSKIWLMDLQHPLIQKFVHHYSRTPNTERKMFDHMKHVGLKLHLTNIESYGFTIASKYSYANWLDLINRLAFHHEVHVSHHISPTQSDLSKYFDMVYVINLKRRPQKLANIKNVIYQLGLTNVNYTFAIDGLELTDQKLIDMGYKTLDGYENPFRGGGMKKGEIGCFLSHYFIWLDAQERNYGRILVLEDDASIIYEDFHKIWAKVQADINSYSRSEGVQTPWELLYLGRRLQKDTYDIETGYEHLVRAGVSFWTVAYALSRRGINKIMDTEPISHALPSDDYLAVMYNQYYEQKIMDKFPRRDLAAYSAVPRLIKPSHFPGDGEYISDTEIEIITDNLSEKTSKTLQKTETNIEGTGSQFKLDSNINKHSDNVHDEF